MSPAVVKGFQATQLRICVRRNPGWTTRKITLALGRTVNRVCQGLRSLERQCIVRGDRTDPRCIRWYQGDEAARAFRFLPRLSNADRVAEILSDAGPLLLRDVAAAAQLSLSSAHQCCTRLERRGQITVRLQSFEELDADVGPQRKPGQQRRRVYTSTHPITQQLRAAA